MFLGRYVYLRMYYRSACIFVYVLIDAMYLCTYARMHVCMHAGSYPGSAGVDHDCESRPGSCKSPVDRMCMFMLI